ncbi:Uma2 family endonuclease [Nodosilinea sp. FACHB-13]|uniref:Uma2 family endonuclease n=1 Tax=Cyanophyceae TaxID=3028117 RepID=UPI001686C4B8|nr:Uma2 family endonuclease [Nodosilinea sp. FACHB-13]MBD2108624.1 Uma2 family endonuclease [Nodosilinea sp. FACHB-13]
MKTLAKWSVDDYHQMIQAGILQARRVELLKGEIVETSPETPIHYTTAKQGAKYLETLLTGKAEVRFNGPVTLGDSEPEPDIAIVRLPESTYRDRHPHPEDIFWLIEVANTSLKQDLDIKAAVYATAGIPEYWVVNLVTIQITIFQQPVAGQYRQQITVQDGNITPLAFNNVAISVKKLLAQTNT